MDQAVAAYLTAIPPEYRRLFDRIHRLVLEGCPDATVGLSYNIPTYKVGSHRLHVGVWKHGLSIYGWKRQGDAGFTGRHPDLQTSTGTIRSRPDDAEAISDDEILELARCALAS